MNTEAPRYQKILKNACSQVGDYTQEVLNTLALGVVILDYEGTIILVNRAWSTFGNANAAVNFENNFIGVNYLSICDQALGTDAESAQFMAAGIRAVMRNEKNEFLIEYPCHTPSEKRWFVCRVTSYKYDGDSRVIITHEDVTNFKLADMEITFQNDERQKRSEELIVINKELSIDAIAFQSQGGVLVTNAKKITLRANRAFLSITGYSEEELIGKSYQSLSFEQDDKAFHTKMWKTVNKTGEWAGEIWNKRKNGEIYPVFLTVTAVKDIKNKVSNYIINLTDITLTKAATEEIHQLAFYDHLTKLPNRRLLVDRLQKALASSARNGWIGALLFLDLDYFKTLNDTLGHDCGDLLLKQVAIRLKECVREDDTVSRIGGDEFVVLLESLSNQKNDAASQAKIITDKILNALNQPYQLAIHKYVSTASIGITFFEGHLLGIEELLQQADIAMYQAKKADRNTVRFFDQKMQDTINSRASIEKDLRAAIEKNQFQLYYQVQVDSSKQTTGAEGLIRWIHPERGLVSPYDFIALAEETGLILPIGQWVLETACAQLKSWQNNSKYANLSISINVSAKQFRQENFAVQLKNTIEHHAINPMLLKLELTESLLLDSVELTIITMNTLKELGVRFSLDDFGTGYSSLQYLKKLPLYQLKIDQSFVRNISVDKSDQSIVRTIIAMASGLELNVIAEGVETNEQWQLLISNGCVNFQGHLFGKPTTIEEFESGME